MTIAVLCCARNSIYKTLPDTDCYDADRGLAAYTGTGPVVAHPPCRLWSAFCSHQSTAPPEEKLLALTCITHLKANGGVLEHPAHSRLWNHLDLPRPGHSKDGLHCIEVHQSWWGYPMMKKTWLLFSGIDPANLVIPFLPHDCGSGVGDRRRQQVMSKNQRAATCKPFAEWLLAAARSATKPTP